MKLNAFFASAIAILVAILGTAGCTASHRLAGAARPLPTLTQSAIDCVVEGRGRLSEETCLKLAQMEADRATATAKEAGAALAAGSDRPVVVAPPYYGGYYYDYDSGDYYGHHGHVGRRHGHVGRGGHCRRDCR